MPLSWGRGLASIVAVKWALALEDFVVQNRPVLNVLYKTKFLTAEPTASRRLRSKLKDCIQDREFERESSLVLDCRGAGAERVSVGNFSSREFWEADPSHIFRVESQSSPRVLVSGGGDGALQDFLGLMIPGKSAREIYENFSEATKVFIEKRIWSIEDEARRSFIWNSDSYQDCVVLSRQHRAHLELIDQVLNDSVIGPEVGGILDNLVKPKTAVAKISLAFHCSHFHPSYALNRFLVLLLDAHLRRNGHSSPLQPNRRLKAVHSAETEDVHQCHNSAIECSRFPHFVYFAQASCEREGTSQPEKEKFDAIVVRHGVQGDLPMLSRQILPYALLWA